MGDWVQRLINYDMWVIKFIIIIKQFYFQVDRNELVLVSEKEKKVNIHNSSVVIARNEDSVQSTVSRANKLKSIVNNLPFDWLAYEELSRLYYSVQIRSVTALSSVATALMAGPCLSYEHSCLRLKSSRERKGMYFHELQGTFLFMSFFFLL